MDFVLPNLMTMTYSLGMNWLVHHNPEINWKTGGFNSQDAWNNVKKWNNFDEVTSPWTSKSQNTWPRKKGIGKRIIPTCYHGFP